MEGERLILADRTILENGRAGYSGGLLWLWFSGMTLAEAAAIALNPQKTIWICYQYGEMEKIYEHYTVCTNIGIDMDGEISVSLRRNDNV